MKRLVTSAAAAATCLLAATAIAGGPPMSIDSKLDSTGNKVRVAWYAFLGKCKEDKCPVGDLTPYKIWDCSLTFSKQFRVKDSGSKWRSYNINVSSFYAPSFASQYLPHSGNGNTEGKKTIVKDLVPGLSKEIDDGLLAAFNACESESASKGWSTNGQTCKPVAGIKVTGRCKYEKFLEPGSYNPSQKQSVTDTLSGEDHWNWDADLTPG